MTPPPTASTSTLDDTAARSATRPAHPRSAVHHLRAAGVSVVVDCQGPRLPRIAHWGADLGDLDDGLLADLVLADVQAVVTNVPGRADHAEHPHRARGRLVGAARTARPPRRPVLVDPVHRLGGSGRRRSRRHPAAGQPAPATTTRGWRCRITLELSPQGVLRTQGTAHATCSPVAASPKCPTPSTVSPCRCRCRGGRPSCSTSPGGTCGSGARSAGRSTSAPGCGTTGGAAPARTPRRCWSPAPRASTSARVRSGRCTPPGAATTASIAERTPNGHAVLAGGELLLPGEIVLAAGGSYVTPWIYGSYAVGLDAMSRPVPRTPAGPARTPAHPPAGHPEHLGIGVLRP